MLYNLHTHTTSHNQNITAIVNRYPYETVEGIPYFSTGIHPWYIDEANLEAHLAIIEQRLQMDNCLALGECGIDKRIDVPLDVQVMIFKKQLQLANNYQKPVILHCVAAHQEMIAIKNSMDIQVPMVMHGFSKNAQVAQQLVNNGFYLSFGKYLLRNPELSGVLAAVPGNRFFLETDTIEESIADVYEKAALARNMNMELLKNTISTNFKTVFRNGGVD